MKSFSITSMTLILLIGSYLHSEIRMGIASDSNFCGERELAWRIKIAGEKLGWRVFLDENRGRGLRKIKDLDWVICVLPRNPYYVRRCANYLTIFHPMNYLDRERKLLPFYEKYNGYLMTIRDRSSITHSLKFEEAGFNAIPFYPTVHDVPYRQLELKELMAMIPVWGNRLTDEKFKAFYRMLTQTEFARFYGLNHHKDIISRGYMGTIPFDGTSVIEVLQKHGVVLVLHSDIHNQEGIPSSRIFEASAASAVIICDENPFVKEHFADTVFYIDTTQDAEGIFSQVQSHWESIQRDPESALDMAKRAHEIFIDRFEMSQQLLRLKTLHQEIQSKHG